MNDEDQAPPVRADLYTHTVATVRRGALADELTSKLAELVRACRETGNTGSLALTLKVKPDRAGETFDLEDSVKLTHPKPVRGKTLFFADDAGNLLRTDPRQPELAGLRSVPDERAGPLKKAE